MRKVLAWAAAVGLALSAGCSGTGAALAGGKVISHLAKGGGDSFLRVSLDGQKAKQSALKKAVVGHSEWKIEERVGTGPTLSFEITKPEKIGASPNKRLPWKQLYARVIE
jgi:hypothetical protein